MAPQAATALCFVSSSTPRGYCEVSVISDDGAVRIVAGVTVTLLSPSGHLLFLLKKKVTKIVLPG